jgi:glycosyltransferase involved in cell wall biosynthesis
MKIGIISTHFFPNPWSNHGGDICIVDLVKSLDEMGHEVSFFAPEGSYVPPHGKLLDMPCNWAKPPPESWTCEQECFNKHSEVLKAQDIVHDFSVTKYITYSLIESGYNNTIATILGGGWNNPWRPPNIVAFSYNQRDRLIRGTTEFENTPTPDMDGFVKYSINDAHVVCGGIDTDFYSPNYDDKKPFFLWLNRWNQLRGYQFAIDLAKKTGIELVLAGTHPDVEDIAHHKNCAFDAINQSIGHKNITFAWLPPDPHHHDAKRILYRSAKAFLWPTQAQDAFGMSQIEAMSCGTPVIATHYGAVPEIIDQGKTGFVCENSIASFAEAVVKIDTIKPENCRETAVQRYDRDVVAKAYLHQYRLVMSGTRW